MQGSKLLKVAGILMIIGGAASILMSILTIAGVGVMGSMAGEALEIEGAGMALAGLALVATIGVLLSGVIELVAGILGAKNANQPEKAKSCIIMGVLIIALSIISLIMNLAGGGNVDWVSFLIGLILPALYVYAAMQLKKLA